MSKSTITTDPLRGSRCWVASSPTLSISDAERRVYHNRSVSDAHNPHRTCGTMWMLICSAMPNPIFALQSLRLSSGNEQNLCNLAHCRVLWSVSSPPSRERQGGVNRVPQALQACILTLTQLSSPRHPGRTKARPYDRMVFHPFFIFYVENTLIGVFLRYY